MRNDDDDNDDDADDDYDDDHDGDADDDFIRFGSPISMGRPSQNKPQCAMMLMLIVVVM